MKMSAITFPLLTIFACCFTAASQAAAFDIAIVDSDFQPPTLTINAGDTVKWTNQGSLDHTATSGTNCPTPDGKWNSGVLSHGQSYITPATTFSSPGTYPYFCSIHCFMTGTIIVNPLATIPSPAGQQIIPYVAAAAPVVSTNPSQAEPVSIGPLAQGGNTLTVQVSLAQFAGPVDIYAAFMVSANPQVINNVKPDLTFQTFSIQQVLQALGPGQPPVGAVPLMANVTTAVSATLFSDIPVALLAPGTYTIFLLVTPTGNLSSFYLWETTFKIL
jgi:plastocyanin